MWNENYGKEIARILNLMADKPNIQGHPTFDPVRAFDGGQVTVHTGVTVYEFADGTEALYGTERSWDLLIKFPNGKQVKISIGPMFCRTCGDFLKLETNVCPQCGSNNDR